MSNGESLTSVRKEYLKAFCTVPAVVKRQQHDLGYGHAPRAVAAGCHHEKMAVYSDRHL
jgi:hypothetical protein